MNPITLMNIEIMLNSEKKFNPVADILATVKNPVIVDIYYAIKERGQMTTFEIKKEFGVESVGTLLNPITARRRLLDCEPLGNRAAGGIYRVAT